MKNCSQDALRNSIRPKPAFCLHFGFTVDDVAVIINRGLKITPIWTDPADKIIILYKTICFLLPAEIDIYPFHVTAKCLHKFPCTCPTVYIGRTERKSYI